jgi:hypothetical protein
MADTTDWEEVGVVEVDSGHVWIGDPCYVLDLTQGRPRELGKTWDDLIPKLVSHDAVQWNFDAGNPGLAVTVASGYGDGGYVVKVRRASDGYVKAVMIEFIDDEAADEQ